MNVLPCREWTIALLLVSSGCAGSLDNAEDYQTVPVGDAGRVSTPQAGRASANAGKGGWGGSKPMGAGAGGWSAPASSGGMNAASGRAGQSARDNSDDDAGVAEASAGAGTGGTEAPPLQPMACDFRALMQAKCGNATCHGGPVASTGLDLTSAMLGSRIAGRQGNGTCSDKLLVDPENPRDSKLYLKISGSTCGSQMPLGGQLNADEQACVLTWIEGL